MKILAWVALVMVFLFALVGPADAKRDDGKRRGCSSDTHQLVVERDEPVPFKLCVFPRDDG